MQKYSSSVEHSVALLTKYPVCNIFCNYGSKERLDEKQYFFGCLLQIQKPVFDIVFRNFSSKLQLYYHNAEHCQIHCEGNVTKSLGFPTIMNFYHTEMEITVV
jgi:hypothetical protein